MSDSQLYTRQTARIARIDSQKFRVGGMQASDWQRIMEAQQELHSLPIFIDDTPRLHVAEIKRRARNAADSLGVKFIAIDYLQMIRGDNRQARKDIEIGDITAEIKGLGKELDIPILLLSQLDRGVESRENKRPRLFDLRESGSIEQDADVIAFLYRDEYYNPKTNHPGVVEFDIAKHRNGPTGTIYLTWISWRQSFENYQNM
jgi:replicative DNA helicase